MLIPRSSLDNLPLEWVRAFEAAGRTGSFSAAAQETGLTQSAISQRIGNLERRLGTQLFLRGARGVVLTVDGETWLPYVSSALRTLQQSSEQLFGMKRNQLVLSASATVIELWITQRLSQLAAADSTQYTFRTMVLSADAALQEDVLRVRYGTGDWAYRFKAPLYQERIAPVASKTLAQSGTDWRELPRIAVSGPRAGWQEWVRQTGDPATPVPRYRFDSLCAALAAARKGLGVVLASLPLCADDLAQGCLVRLGEEEMLTPDTYWLLAPDGVIGAGQWRALKQALTAPTDTVKG
ncbi:LysR family transcriptional regulator [Marinobacterium nitratireducens]|uniref:LysR family transcriptional regulator n=1 Tax=Marinobacterium nitratireducens TaxID=518897 RepID=A0A917Z4U1_9GAMM|nr:LysR family transcriptional regulator [Marinobacterium nitratireducens]GGO75379.1 LysR family transcriptional regulator [Marinobacterium nitratireducens]